MIDLSDYIVVGDVTKTHGVRGQIVLQLNDLSFENILKLESVIIEMDGLPVPFFIDSFTKRNNNSIILTIEDISNEQKAEKFIDKIVYLKPEDIRQEKPIISSADKLLGFTVIDNKKGKLGILEEILDNQYNPLLRILDGKKEVLIPFQAEFILKIEKKSKTIIVETPLGLTELFD
jgi:16S rRNA processing protein RimM